MSQFTQWFNNNVSVNELSLSMPPKNLTEEKSKIYTHAKKGNAPIKQETQKSEPVEIPHTDDPNIKSFIKYEKIWKELIYQNVIMDGSKIFTLQERFENHKKALPLLKKMIPIGRTFFMSLKNDEVELKFEQFLVMRLLKLGSNNQSEENKQENFSYGFKTFAEGKAKRLFNNDIRQRISDLSAATLGFENCRNILTKTGGKNIFEKEDTIKIDPLPNIMDKWGNLVPKKYTPEMAAIAIL